MRVSVIVPTLNEASNIERRAREIACQTGPIEWIVADGGSSDATRELAAAAGATVVVSERGRGAQLDRGAACASGDVLLFLHADTALPPGAIATIRVALGDARVVGGNFTLRFDEPTLFPRFFAGVYALQQWLFGVYYGDSAIFVRAQTYRTIGGFGPIPIMEDYAFVTRLRRAGRTVKLPTIVTTSARRFSAAPLRALWVWLTILVLYHLGVPPQRLAQLYRPHRADGESSTSR